MELKALNETDPAVVAHEPGVIVEIDAGTGVIVEAQHAPNGQVYYVIDHKLPNGETSTCTRWHDEIALHPIDAAVMAIADGKSDASIADTLNAEIASGAWKMGITPTIDAKFRAMLDKGAAIIASIDTIKPLDLVVLKSGGPQMLVEKIHDGDAIAWWMDHTANLHVARFPVGMLDLVPNFNHAELRA